MAPVFIYVRISSPAAEAAAWGSSTPLDCVFSNHTKNDVSYPGRSRLAANVIPCRNSFTSSCCSFHGATKAKASFFYFPSTLFPCMRKFFCARQTLCPDCYLPSPLSFPFLSRQDTETPFGAPAGRAQKRAFPILSPCFMQCVSFFPLLFRLLSFFFLSKKEIFEFSTSLFFYAPRRKEE